MEMKNKPWIARTEIFETNSEITESLLKHKKKIIKGFVDSFEFIQELDKHPEKLKRLPDKGTLERRGKKFIVKSKDEKKLIII